MTEWKGNKKKTHEMDELAHLLLWGQRASSPIPFITREEIGLSCHKPNNKKPRSQHIDDPELSSISIPYKSKLL